MSNAIKAAKPKDLGNYTSLDEFYSQILGESTNSSSSNAKIDPFTTGIRNAHRDISRDPSQNLRLKLRKEYRFQAPLGPAKLNTVNRILLKRNKKTGVCEVLGHIDQDFHFDTLADYHYSAPRSLNYGADVIASASIADEIRDAQEQSGLIPEIESAERYIKHNKNGQVIKSESANSTAKKASKSILPPEMLYLPPPCYTKTVHPTDYNFEENPMVKADGTIVKKNGWIPLSLAKHDIKEVFSKPPKDADPASYFDRVEKFGVPPQAELLRQVQQLFEKRPMWLRTAIVAEVREALHANWWMQRALQAVAFSWTNGPFKDAYCLLGYDPRQDKNAAKYQTIDFRDKELNKKINAAGAASGGADGNNNKGIGADKNGDNDNSDPYLDVHFTRAPRNRSQVYMLCDIKDDKIEEIYNAHVSGKFDSERYGWLKPDAMPKIRDRMQVLAAGYRGNTRAAKPLYLENK